MTTKEFVKKWLGKKADFDGAYAGQCVDLFRFFNKEVLEIPQPKGVVDAKDFWTNYETDSVLKDNFIKIANTPTAVPQEGDVMIWGAWKDIEGLPDNEFGHISIYLRGDVKKFTSLDQNFPTLSKVTETEHNYTSPKVLGWLRPKKFVANPCEELENKYKVSREEYNELKADYSELRKRWDKRDIEFDLYKQKNEDLLQANEDLRKNNAKHKADIEELTKLNLALVEETKLYNAIKNAVLNLFRSKP